LRWLYARRDLAEARSDLTAWLARWAGKYSRLTAWVEENLEETLSFYRLPRQHHKHLKSTNMSERLNEEIKRRTQVVRIFPNAQSCLRLIRALAVETHENWLEQHRYLNMEELREHKNLTMRQAALTPPRALRRALPKGLRSAPAASRRPHTHDPFLLNLTHTTNEITGSSSSFPAR
jgi:putative transposase